MSRLILAAAALLAAAPAASAHEVGTPSRFPLLEWSVDSTSRADGKVQLSMRTNWDGQRGSSNWSSGYSLAELQGLSAGQLASTVATPVRFAIVREAGRFDCSGVAVNRVGNGNCRFTAQPEFAAMLAARGIGRPSPRESYHLAMSGAGRALLDALAANGYPRPTLDDFVKLAIHRVDVDYIRGMAALGPQFRNIGARDLVKLHIHRVSPELVRAYARHGYSGLDRDDLLAMSIHRVTPEYIEELSRQGYRSLSARQLVKMRIFGVTPEYIRSLQQSGIRPPSAEQLVKLRMSGFTPGDRR